MTNTTCYQPSLARRSSHIQRLYLAFASWLPLATACTLAFGILLAWSGVAAAASIVGTIGFNIQGNVSSGTLDLKPSITFTNVRTNNTATDDWKSFTSNHVAGGMLAMDKLTVGDFSSVGQSISFANGGFGSFSGKVFSDEVHTVGVGFLSSSTRLVTAKGVFTPGTTLSQSGFNRAVIGQMSIFFQGFTGGFRAAPGARSGTIVMSTQPVPEPGTIAIVVAGSATLFGIMRRRRKAFQPI